MGIIELREQIHDRINKADDLQLLAVINEILGHTEKVFQIPEQFLKGIEQGIEDCKSNNFITLGEFELKYKKRLSD